MDRNNAAEEWETVETIQITATSPSFNCSSSLNLFNDGWSSRRVSAEHNSRRNLPLNSDELEDYLELIELPGSESERTTMTSGIQGLFPTDKRASQKLTWQQRWFCCCLEPRPATVTEHKATTIQNKSGCTQLCPLFRCGKTDPLLPNLQPMCRRIQSIAQINFNDQEPMHFRMLVTVFSALVDPLEAIAEWPDRLESDSLEADFDHSFVETPFDLIELRQLPVQRISTTKCRSSTPSFRIDSLSLVEEFNGCAKSNNQKPQISQQRKLSSSSTFSLADSIKEFQNVSFNERLIDDCLNKNSILSSWTSQGSFEQAMASLPLKCGSKVPNQLPRPSLNVAFSNQENDVKKPRKMHSLQNECTEKLPHLMHNEKLISNYVESKFSKPEMLETNLSNEFLGKNEEKTENNASIRFLSENGGGFASSVNNDETQQHQVKNNKQNANEVDTKVSVLKLQERLNEPILANQRPEVNHQTFEYQSSEPMDAETLETKNCSNVVSYKDNKNGNEHLKYQKQELSNENDDTVMQKQHANAEKTDQAQFSVLQICRHSSETSLKKVVPLKFSLEQKLDITDQESHYYSLPSSNQNDSRSERQTVSPSIIPERGWMIDNSLEKKDESEESEISFQPTKKFSHSSLHQSHSSISKDICRDEVQIKPERLPVRSQSSVTQSRQNSFYSTGNYVRQMNSFRPNGFITDPRRSDASVACGLFSRDASARQSRVTSLPGGFGNSYPTWLPRFGPHWQKIGFQGHDPASDLRCVGILALFQLCFLVTDSRCHEIAGKAYRLSRHPQQKFPLAALGVNLTLVCIQLLRSGHLNRLCNKRNQIYGPLNLLYAGLWNRFCRVWNERQCNISHTAAILQELRSYAKKRPEKLIQRLLQENQTDIFERRRHSSRQIQRSSEGWTFWRRSSTSLKKQNAKQNEPPLRFTDISQIEQQPTTSA